MTERVNHGTRTNWEVGLSSCETAEGSLDLAPQSCRAAYYKGNASSISDVAFLKKPVSREGRALSSDSSAKLFIVLVGIMTLLLASCLALSNLAVLLAAGAHAAEPLRPPDYQVGLP